MGVRGWGLDPKLLDRPSLKTRSKKFWSQGGGAVYSANAGDKRMDTEISRTCLIIAWGEEMLGNQAKPGGTLGVRSEKGHGKGVGDSLGGQVHEHGLL